MMADTSISRTLRSNKPNLKTRDFHTKSLNHTSGYDSQFKTFCSSDSKSSGASNGSSSSKFDSDSDSALQIRTSPLNTSKSNIKPTQIQFISTPIQKCNLVNGKPFLVNESLVLQSNNVSATSKGKTRIPDSETQTETSSMTVECGSCTTGCCCNEMANSSSNDMNVEGDVGSFCFLNGDFVNVQPYQYSLEMAFIRHKESCSVCSTGPRMCNLGLKLKSDLPGFFEIDLDNTLTGSMDNRVGSCLSTDVDIAYPSKDADRLSVINHTGDSVGASSVHSSHSKYSRKPRLRPVSDHVQYRNRLSSASSYNNNFDSISIDNCSTKNALLSYKNKRRESQGSVSIFSQSSVDSSQTQTDYKQEKSSPVESYSVELLPSRLDDTQFMEMESMIFDPNKHFKHIDIDDVLDCSRAVSKDVGMESLRDDCNISDSRRPGKSQSLRMMSKQKRRIMKKKLLRFKKYINLPDSSKWLSQFKTLALV